jgi:hypothetical protein
VILISRTFTEATQDQLEQGEFARDGIVHKAQPFGFRELCCLIHKEGFRISNEYPAKGGPFEWLATPFRVIDPQTKMERMETLHFSRSNPVSKAKYWRKAFKVNHIH